MAQGTDHEMQWTLGKLRRRSDGSTDLDRWRPVSDEEAEQLQASSRLVRDLGSQRDLQSLVAAVERWLETVERVGERLTAGETLPEALLTAAALDLAAIAHAAARCERGILATSDSLRAQGYADAGHTEAVEAAGVSVTPGGPIWPVRRSLRTRGTETLRSPSSTRQSASLD